MWKVTLNETLTLYANSHTPSTGGEVDSDAAPSYRIYEGTTTAPILTGNYALHDDANTTGFYSVDIAVTVANGFEAGKTYCARTRAVVGGVPGVKLFEFGVTTRGLDDILPTATYTAPPAVGDVADAVWDEASAQHLAASTTGEALAAAGNGTAAQTGLTAQGYTTTRAGYLDTLNGLVAAVWNNATRTLTAVSDSSGITTLLTRISAAITITGGKVDVNDKTGFSLSSAGVQAIWDALTSALTTPGSVGKWIIDKLDAAISSIAGAAGAGAITYVYTLTSSVNASPIGQADVWVTTDSAGTNVIASGTTNDSGVVTFYLDAGTYYCFRSKSGFNFTNPQTIVVS